MANTFLPSNLIAAEAVAQLAVNNTFLATSYKKYEGMFSSSPYKSGDTINVRLDNFFVGSRGDTVAAENIVEESTPVTIQPLYSVPITYTPTDLQRKIEDFSDEVIRPAVRRLAAMINRDIAQAALTQVSTWVGDAATNLNTFESLDQVNPIMDNLAMSPEYNRYVALNPTQVQKLRSASSLQNSFVSPLNKEITMDASLGRLADFDIFKDQSISSHTAGSPGAGVTVKTAVSTGNTIALQNMTVTTGTFKAGDVISIAGVQEFNPITRTGTGRDIQFTIQNDVTADGSGDAAITVEPAMKFSGPRQNMTSASDDIAVGAAVTTVGSHMPNIAYTERGLIACLPPLEVMDSPESHVAVDKDTGISIRISKTAEVLNNKNVMRLDAQCAYKWINSQAVRLVSAA